jgi:hypothetical protein
VARPMLPGRLLDPVSNDGARGMITIPGFGRGNRTRLTDPLPLFFEGSRRNRNREPRTPARVGKRSTLPNPNSTPIHTGNRRQNGQFQLP